MVFQNGASHCGVGGSLNFGGHCRKVLLRKSTVLFPFAVVDSMWLVHDR